MDALAIELLNALSAGLLLFMLGAGLTLIFSMMGVINFAHAAFYMIGAYLGYACARVLGFWPALVLAPLAAGLGGAVFERACLRRVRAGGPVAELLVTFGLATLLTEAVQLVWGRAAVPNAPPAWLRQPAFTLVHRAGEGLGVVAGAAPPALCAQAACSPFPATRAFMMGLALAMLLALWAGLARTRTGLVVRAALTHPQMVQALGHDVPRVFTAVFGAGCALAALAGVVGGMTFVTEPSMAASLGPLLFVVVVVGGMGSLGGAFAGALVVGMLQTLPLSSAASLADVVRAAGWQPGADSAWAPVLRLTLAQLAPILPYLLLVVMLVVRPQGLAGRRDG